jgi:hypothetical protein
MLGVRKFRTYGRYVGSSTPYTVIRFVSISATVNLACAPSWIEKGHLLKLIYAHSSIPSVYFSFNKCPI